METADHRNRILTFKGMFFARLATFSINDVNGLSVTTPGGGGDMTLKSLKALESSPGAPRVLHAGRRRGRLAFAAFRFACDAVVRLACAQCGGAP